MFLSSLLLSSVLGAAAPQDKSAPGVAQIPDRWVLGDSFRVTLNYEGGAAGLSLQAWQLTAAAFDLNGEPLRERSNSASIPLAAGDSLQLNLDLAPLLAGQAGFQLGLAGAGQEAQSVRVYAAVDPKTEFMSLASEALAGHLVLINTTRGEMLFEVWPEVAPGHVRNWLDLAHSGFYERVQFHRVSPTFMIQGGCPSTRTDRRNEWGKGSGPRNVKLELSDRKHEKGVLSMARGEDPDSGSSQFFVITRASPQLDGRFSTFGKLLSGYDVLAKIGNAPGVMKDGTATPHEPQRILKATVVRELIAEK